MDPQFSSKTGHTVTVKIVQIYFMRDIIFTKMVQLIVLQSLLICFLILICEQCFHASAMAEKAGGFDDLFSNQYCNHSWECKELVCQSNQNETKDMIKKLLKQKVYLENVTKFRLIVPDLNRSNKRGLHFNNCDMPLESASKSSSVRLY